MLSQPPMRALTSREIALFPTGFTSQIDMSRVRLIGRTHNPFAIGKIVARGYDLYWKDYPDDFAQQSLRMRALLMHELCHVWQYASGRLTAWRYLTRPQNWIYGYDFDAGKSFDDYAIEKQADLLQDWYVMNNGGAPCRQSKERCAPTRTQINAIVPFMWDIAPDVSSDTPLDDLYGLIV